MIKFFYAFVLLLTSFLVYSQNENKLDSLRDVYKNQKQDSSKVNTAHALYGLYYVHKPKLALQYSLEGLNLAKKINYTKGIAKSFNHKGKHFMITRKIDSSRYYFTKSLDIYNSLNDKHGAGLVAYNMIQLLYVTANYEKAQQSISENLEKYCAPNPDSIIMLKLYLARAKVCMRQTEYNKGFESALKALAIAEALKLESEKIKVKSTLASLYHYTNNKEKSIEIKKELLGFYRKQNNGRKIGLTLNDLGNSNYVIKKYDIALKYLNESVTIQPQSHSYKQFGEVYLLIFLKTIGFVDNG